MAEAMTFNRLIQSYVSCPNFPKASEITVIVRSILPLLAEWKAKDFLVLIERRWQISLTARVVKLAALSEHNFLKFPNGNIMSE